MAKSLNQNEGYAYLFDTAVILRVKLESHTTECLVPPKGKYISAFSEQEDGYHMEVYGGVFRQKFEQLSYPQESFLPGMGQVKNGLFPSAYKKHVDHVAQKTPIK